MKNLLYLFAAFLVLQSMTCEPEITFYEPQPEGTASLKSIPKSLAGKYICKDDQSVVEIGDAMIIGTLDFDYTIPENSLDSSEVISGDYILNLETGEKTRFTPKGDSLVLHIHEVDTLFNLQEGHVLRKFRDDCYLNVMHEPEKWEVIKVEMNKNQLTLSRIDKDQELQTLIDITRMPQDTIPPYRFKATKSQFSKFVKAKGFKDQKVYVKL
jgi:hypothetical protein